VVFVKKLLCDCRIWGKVEVSALRRTIYERHVVYVKGVTYILWEVQVQLGEGLWLLFDSLEPLH